MEYTRVGSHSLYSGSSDHGSNPGSHTAGRQILHCPEPQLKDATGNLGACASHKIICSCNDTNHYLNLKAAKLGNDQIEVALKGEYKPNLD